MIAGTAYGVILNDRQELAARAEAFDAAPYKGQPRAPVLYIKPRGCFAYDGTPVTLPDGVARVTVAATIAVLFDGGAVPTRGCLALEVSEPHSDYYRPAIRERCRDSFLPLGAIGPLPATPGARIVTRRNGAEVHAWTLDRLVRPIPQLIADVSAFMTLAEGDLLLVGLAGDAPYAEAGDVIDVSAEGFALLHVDVVAA